MKNNRKIMCLLGVVSLLSGLVSCGESSSSDKPSEKVQIDFWHTFGQGIISEVQCKIDSFKTLVKENEGVDVEITMGYQGSYDDIENKISKGFAAGNVPTLAVAYPDHVADYLYSEPNNGDYVVNLQSYIDDDKIGLGKESYLNDTLGADDFIQSYYNEGNKYAKRGMYSIPLMKSTEVMFYNKDAVALAMPYYNSAYGTDYTSDTSIDKFISSMSWDDFMNVCRVIKDNKSSILNTLENPAWYDSDGNLFITKMFQEKIPYSSISERGVGQIDFASGTNLTDAKAMVTSLKEQYDEGLFTTKGIKGTYGSDNFKNGKCVFSIGSSGGTGYQVPTGGSFNVGVCRVPDSNDNPVYVSQGPTLTILKKNSISNSENESKIKYAWKFIKYLTNSQNNVEICVNGSEGYVPVRESSYETEDYLTYLEDAEIYAQSAKVVKDDIGDSYITSSVFPGSAKLRDEGGSLLTQVFNGNKTIDTAFADAINNAMKDIK